MTSTVQGKATGESYTITIECTGGSGNSPTRGIAVTVPHGQGNGDGKKVHPLDSIVVPISLKGPLATPPSPVKVEGGADEGQVGECLREVAPGFPVGANLFGI